MSKNENILVRNAEMDYNALPFDSPQRKEWDEKVSTEIKRLNTILFSLLPILHERMKIKYGDELKAWLEKGYSKGVFLAKDKSDGSYWSGVEDDIENYARDSYYLDMKGWDGLYMCDFLSPDDKKELRMVIDSFIESRSVSYALKSLIEDLRNNFLPEKNRDNIVFFIYGAIKEDRQPQEIAYLWILESGLYDRYDYMFLLGDGEGMNQAWRLCLDVLPAELIPVLDLEYI